MTEDDTTTSALTAALTRFGSLDGLTLGQQTTMNMGLRYATEYGLEARFLTDPEVCIAAVTLAKAREMHMTLMLQIEVDIERRLRQAEEGTTYGDIVFKLAKSGTHLPIYEEMSRLDVLATQFDERLSLLQGRHAPVVLPSD